jgi:Bax protein
LLEINPIADRSPMNARIARAADVGRNYALVGAFAACLAGAWALPPDIPPARAAALRDAAGDNDDEPAPTSAAAIGPMHVGLDLPLPWQTPSFELVFAVPPATEPAITELPMAELPPLDMTIADLGVTHVDGGTTSSQEARPLHGRLSHAIGPLRRQVTQMRVTATSELAQAFQAHDYTLDQTRRGEPVPALQIDRVPGDLVNVRDVNERKELFIKALLPIVLETNERILAERHHLLRLHERHAAGRSLSVIERMWLAEVADRYGTEPGNFVELLRRVDMVPPSMAIAQAGVESGWGTSYAARVGNSLFGQIRAGRGQIPQPFPSVADAVEAYILNLNTHFAYAEFRIERARLRASGAELDGYHLIGQLRRYSEMGQFYINFVRGLIRENRLSDFDRARLSPI